ncbi:MAG: ferrochelatase, partial [Candidatus Nucleicultricaceae bacterium]
ENTILQKNALQRLLGDDFSVHIAMRYWHPRADALIQGWKENPPKRIVLLPLYPQFSTTTSGSSINEWLTFHQKAGLRVPVHSVCCYPENQGFVEAQALLLKEAIKKQVISSPYRILFSAHGLPKRIVDAGDPYPDQVEATARAIVQFLGDDSLDWRVCYQSRVGPVEWIKPYADDEIRQCGQEGKGIVLVPLSFVSEHSETLIELDVEFKKIAEESGVPFYCRVPTVGVSPSFIEALQDLVIQALNEPALSTKASSMLYTDCSKCCNGVRRA